MSFESGPSSEEVGVKQETKEEKKEKLAQELKQAEEMLKYCDEQLQEMTQRFNDYKAKSEDPNNPNRHQNLLSADDCLKEMNRWQESVNNSKAKIERIETELRMLG
jgi:chromosome segregation ATPase